MEELYHITGHTAGRVICIAIWYDFWKKRIDKPSQEKAKVHIQHLVIIVFCMIKFFLLFLLSFLVWFYFINVNSKINYDSLHLECHVIPRGLWYIRCIICLGILPRDMKWLSFLSSFKKKERHRLILHIITFLSRAAVIR